MRRVRSQFPQAVFGRSASVAVGALVAATAALGLLPGAALAADCPNEELREQQGVTAFPACMALEMASPPTKGNAAATIYSFGADGNRVRFQSQAALGDTPGVIVGSDWYLASRGENGWSTTATSPPGEYGLQGKGTPVFWSDRYSRWFSITGTETQGDLGIMSILEGGFGMDWLVRSPTLTPVGFGFGRDVYSVDVQGASPDLSHLVFKPGAGSTSNASRVQYFAGDPVPAGVGSMSNAYVWAAGLDGDGSLALLARDADGTVVGGNCGATPGGGVGLTIGVVTGELNQGAISADGKRMYFTTRGAQPPAGDCDMANKLRIFQREETPGGVEISQLVSSECARVAPACDPTDGDDFFQAASADGTKVYFTTTRQLADSDVDSGSACAAAVGSSAGCDLYLYDATRPAGQRLTQVSAGEATDATPGADAKVLSSIVAVSGDGSRAYFVATDILTTAANAGGQSAVAGQPNLYVYERDEEQPDGEVSFVGTLDASDSGAAPVWGGGRSNLRSNAAAVPLFDQAEGGTDMGGDGHILVFRSVAPLTADDTDGGKADIYRYDAEANALARVSKASPGGSDNGPFDVDSRGQGHPPGPNGADELRSVSEDGRVIVFSTFERLSAVDTDEVANVYLWHGGELTATPGDGTISMDANASGRSTDTPVVSRSGNEIAFATRVPLLPQDGDIARDVYVARTDGGFPLPPSPSPCDSLAGGCQGAGSDSLDWSRETGRSGRGNAVPGPRARFRVAALSTAKRSALAKGKRVGMKVRVNVRGRVRVRAVARVAGRSRTVAFAGRFATAGKTVVLPLALSKSARRQLSRRGSLRVRLSVSFSKAAKPARSTIVLKRAAKRRAAGTHRGGSR